MFNGLILCVVLFNKERNVLFSDEQSEGENNLLKKCKGSNYAWSLSINHLRRDTFYITVKVRRVYRLTLGTDVHNIYATTLSSLDTECRADYQV